MEEGEFAEAREDLGFLEKAECDDVECTLYFALHFVHILNDLFEF